MKCRGLSSVLLQSHAELVVGGRQLHQGLLDPEGGVAHLAVLVPALSHQCSETGQNLKVEIVNEMNMKVNSFPLTLSSFHLCGI